LHHDAENSYTKMSDVGCDRAETLRTNANSIWRQDEECVQLHPDSHDAMLELPAKKSSKHSDITRFCLFCMGAKLVPHTETTQTEGDQENI
jgi:hypothetical protein